MRRRERDRVSIARLRARGACLDRFARLRRRACLMRARLVMSVAIVLGTLLLSGCSGQTAERRPAREVPAVLPSPWPSAADYTTIRIARDVMFHSLTRETDWRRRAFGATLGMRTLLSVRVTAGRCATYVGRLYSELFSLSDGYAGEDWRPLVRLVRHDPSVRSACRGPARGSFNASL